MTLFGRSMFVLFFGGITPTCFLMADYVIYNMCGQYVTNIIYII